MHLPIRAAWEAALSAAALESPAELWIFDGPKSGAGDCAVWWSPDCDLSTDPDACSIIDELADARRRGVHTIAIWPDDRPLAVNVALLAHELRHARQFEVCAGELLDLRDLALHALRASTWPRARELYSTLPDERDADRVASRYVRDVYGDAEIDAIVTTETAFPHLLRRQESAEPLADLKDRMIEFLAWAGVACDRYAETTPFTFAQLLEAASPGSSARWWELRLRGGPSIPM